MKKFTTLLPIILVLLLFPEHQTDAAYTLDDVVNCSLNTEQKNYWSQRTNFESYLEDHNIPLTKNGRAINKNYAINRCLVVYGTPYDVPTVATGSQKAKQSWSSNGEPRYLGYSLSGGYYANNKFPNDEGGSADYLISWKFIKYPWNNSTLVYQGNSSSFSKPAPIAPSSSIVPTYVDENGHLFTKAEELDRAIDMQYLTFRPNGPKGLRGYFPDYNPFVGHTMRGSNIVDYASVSSYPTEYTSGQFNLYLISHNSGTYWYSSWVIPAHKPLFKGVPDLKVEITNVSPNPGHTNQTATVTYKVTLVSDYKINNVDVLFGWNNNGLTGKRHSVINPGTSTHTVTIKYPKTNKRIKNENLYMYINKNRTSPKNESNWNNNKDTYQVAVENPNAYVKLFLNSSNDLYARVYNQMIDGISQSCVNSSSTQEVCKTGTSKRNTVIQLYDTKMTQTKSDDTLVQTVSIPNFTISSTQSQKIPITTPDANKDSVVMYRVVAQIPEFQGEVDFNGSPKYDDNYKEDYVVVYPNLPPVTLDDCNQLNVSYVNELDGVGPIKSCAGHYPKYPSTFVENGMGVYHFVLWRFFPTPFPAYEIRTPALNSDPANAFRQTYSISEPSNTVGNKNTFLYYPTGSNSAGLAAPYTQREDGEYMYRGRLFPTDATFTFSIYDTINDSSASNGYRKNVLVAFGSLSHDIPSHCYDDTKLDLVHRFGCDEILFFLPNSQANMMTRPPNFTGTNIDLLNNPIQTTKIPYLNPGKYVFELKANENFQYRYQHDDGYYTQYSSTSCDAYGFCTTSYWRDVPWNRVWGSPKWYNNPIN